MSISSAQAIYGLNAIGVPTGTNLSGSTQIGIGATSVQLTDSDVAYSLRAILFGTGDELHLAPKTGSTSGSTAFVAGTAQVETATAAGGITGSGNATVTVTGAYIDASPVAVSVAVVNGDTAAQWADKARVALAANAAIAAKFTVSGASTAIILTAKPSGAYSSFPIYRANDATLNIALANGTCTGITAAPTSADTTAGVATGGAKIYDGDGLDFEGVALAAIDNLNGVLIKCAAGNGTFDDSAGTSGVMSGDSSLGYYSAHQISNNTGSTDLSISPIVFASTLGPCDFTVTVIGKS